MSNKVKLVRKSVFETNSSSCHTVSVGNSDVYIGMCPDPDGVINLYPMEFGWSQETFYDVESRMAYAFIYLRDWCHDEKQKKFTDTFMKVVTEHTGATSVVMPSEKTSWGYDSGYIDHQSVDSNDLDYIFEDEATLKSFLFDDNSYIETDNDNH